MSTSEWKEWTSFLEDQGFDVDGAKRNGQNHWEYRCFCVDCPHVYRDGGQHSTPLPSWKSVARRVSEQCRTWKCRLADVEAKSTTAPAAPSKLSKKQQRSDDFRIEHVSNV